MCKDASGSGHPTHPRQACLAKASCNWSTWSNLLGESWLHVISMTLFFLSGIQKFQGLCTLHPLHSFRQRKTSNHTEKKLIETHFQSRKMYKLFLPTCWKVDRGRQTPGEFVASACVAGAAFGHWTFECEKDLVCQLLFGIYSKHRPKTKDLQPAKNELAAINVELMDLVPAPLLVAMLALIAIASWGVCTLLMSSTRCVACWPLAGYRATMSWEFMGWPIQSSCFDIVRHLTASDKATILQARVERTQDEKYL